MCEDKFGNTYIYPTLCKESGDNSYILHQKKKIRLLRFVIVYCMHAVKVLYNTYPTLYRAV